MMAHPAFVQIWKLLELRSDTTNILREILGDHSICSTGEKKKQKLHTLAFHLVIRLKVLFDMQRTYLQSSNPTHESRSSRIPPSLLLAAVHQVIRILFEIYNPDTQTNTDHLPHASLIAATALSGLRALMLQKDMGINVALAHEVRKLIVKLRKMAWETSEIEQSEVEALFLRKCLIAIDIIAPDEQSGVAVVPQTRQPACGKFELEDCARTLVSRNCLLIYFT
jgi:hypothetical protein